MLGGAEGARTLDPQNANLVLFQLSYRPKVGAGDGNRTHVSSLEGWGSTIELHPQAFDVKGWQARRDSNPQPAVLETAALPLELLACKLGGP